MSDKKYYDQSMDDIVFEYRNKVYGAYYLRRIYSRTLLLAFSITISAFILAVFTPDILNAIWQKNEVEIARFDTNAVILVPPPPIKEYSTSIPPPAANDQQAPVKPDDDIQNKTMVASDKSDPADNKDHNSDTSKNQGKSGAKGSNGNDIYAMNNVDLPPIFRDGGDDGLEKLIKDNLTYPEGPRTKGIEGEVMVVFTVELDGSISNVSVQGRNDKELEAEAVRIIRLTNGKWIPASKRRTPVRCVCKFPISFVF